MLFNGPSRAQIEVTNRCNLNCSMCPRLLLNLPCEDMKYDIFLQIIERLKGVQQVWLTGWGEPLLNQHIFEMAKKCKEKGFFTGVTTNGMLQSGVEAQSLAIFDSINFSMESITGSSLLGHQSNKTVDTIEKILSMQGSNTKQIITLQSVYNGKNAKNILEIIEWAKDKRIDSIKIIPFNCFHNKDIQLPAIDYSQLKKFYNDAIILGKENGVRVDVPNIAIGKGIKRLIYSIGVRVLKILGINCLKTINYVYVTLDGKVTPCCELPRSIVGDLMKDSLADIWRGKLMKQFRKDAKNLCKGCAFSLTGC